MAKKKKAGEQLELIDVGPENMKGIVAKAKEYKEVMTARVKMLAKECALKEEIRGMIKDSDLHPLKDGVIRFQIEDIIIALTPQNEKISVKKAKEKKQKK